MFEVCEEVWHFEVCMYFWIDRLVVLSPFVERRTVVRSSVLYRTARTVLRTLSLSLYICFFFGF